MAKTDGVPLFVEELTKTAGVGVIDRQYHYELTGPALAIPATLQDSDARLTAVHGQRDWSGAPSGESAMNSSTPSPARRRAITAGASSW